MGISIGIYKKQTALLVVILALGFFSFLALNIYQRGQASEKIGLEQFQRGGNNDIDLELQKNGALLYSEKTIKNVIFLEKDYDELRYVILEEPGFFLNQLIVNLKLPESLSDKNLLEPIAYAIHGVGSSDIYWQGGELLIYKFANIAPTAQITIVAKLPKGLISPSLSDKIFFALNNYLSKIWLYLGFLLFLATFLPLFFIWFLRWKDKVSLRTRKISKNIPGGDEPEPPAVIGVLLNGRITEREIAATIVDLARRGYVYIFQGRDHFSFGKGEKYRQNNRDLHYFEKVLLSKIFEEGRFKSTKSDIDKRVGGHIFSHKIAQTYLEIYNMATKAGYFVSDPVKVQSKYKYFAIVAFFVASLGFFLSLFLGPKPNYSIYLFAGMILSSLGINWLAPLIPVRTKKGQNILRQWLAFSNYLGVNIPFAEREINKDAPEQYLSYAIVMGKEKKWLSRYGNRSFNPPKWFDSYQKVITVEDFGNVLFSITGYVGQILSATRDPIVD